MDIPPILPQPPSIFEEVVLRRGTGFSIRAVIPQGAESVEMTAREFYQKARHEDWTPRRADAVITFRRIKYSREFLEERPYEP